MAIKRSRFQKGVELIPEDLNAEDLSREGELAYDSDSDKLKYRNASATKEVVNTDEAQTMENKTIDATAATGNNSISIDASDAAFDNSTSGMSATDAQGALDELDSRVDSAETNLSDHLSDAVDAHDASAISNVPSGNLVATDVQGALDELQTDVDSRALASDLTDHINDAADAHDASAISNVPSGNLVATDVQGALDELQTDVDSRALSSDLTDHINDAADAHDASAISNVPAGNLVATDVQGALNELQSDVDTRLLASDLTVHEADTSTHGVTEIVGTSESQVLTNKDIDGGTASNTSRITLPKETKANLDALTRKEATLVYATDQNKAFIDNGTDLIPVGSGEGTGAYNYIENGTAELNTDGWTVYANTTAASKPDDFGGTPAGVTFTRSTTSPLVGDGMFVLSKDAADRQGEGVYYEFTAEEGHKTLKNLLRMISDTSDANISDGDLSFYLVGSNDDFTADFLTISAPSPELIAGNPQILKLFQFNADKTKYRLCIHVASTNALAYSASFDDIVFGPSVSSTSSIMSDWVQENSVTIDATTTAPGKGVTVTDELYYRRVGDSLEVRMIYRKTSGGSSGSGDYLFKMPDGFKIDTDKVKAYATVEGFGGYVTDNIVGNGQAWTGGIVETAVMVYDEDYVRMAGTSATNIGFISSGFGSMTNNATTFYALHFTVPIKGFSTGQISSKDFSGREIYVSAYGNSGGTLTANVTDAPYDTTLFDTTGAWDGSGFVAPETGVYDVSGMINRTNNDNCTPEAYIDGTLSQRLNSPIVGTSQIGYSGKVYLEKDQRLSIRIDATSTMNSATEPIVRHRIDIYKLANPQQIVDAETVSASYSTNSGQTLSAALDPVIFEDLEHDTHNAYNTSTGVYTIPLAGFYSLKYIIRQVSGTGEIAARVSGNNLISVKTNDAAANTMEASIDFYAEKGDEVDIIHGLASARTLNSSELYNKFSITRLK